LKGNKLSGNSTVPELDCRLSVFVELSVQLKREKQIKM
jgi:hypothetical protein